MALAMLVESGVGVESLVWSPCSSLLSYSPPPNLSDLEADIEDDLNPDAVHPPSPPQSSPSSPTDADILTTRVMPPEAELPQPVSEPTTTTYDPLSPLNDRLRVSVLPRTRKKCGVGRSPRKRTSVHLPQTPHPAEAADVKCNDGQVTSEPALLARLSGLSGTDEAPPGQRTSPRRNRSRGANGVVPSAVSTGPKWSSHREGFRFKDPDKQSGPRSKDKKLSSLINKNNNSILRTTDGDSSCIPSLSSYLPPSYEASSGSPSSGLGSSLGEGTSTPSSNSSGYSTPVPSPAPASTSSTQTRKVRFPPPEKKHSGDVCRWQGCGITLDYNSSLLEHIQAVHVESQLEAESFRCLWEGCKVFERASCSVSWLEGHVLNHGGNKPFKCIVDGCGHRFRSQTALGRHVNHHFNSLSAPPAARSQGQSSPVKLIRKNGRKLRYRKRPFSARIFDFFDLSTMEKVKWGLMCGLESQISLDNPGSEIAFKSQVICRRKNFQGVTEALVKWRPSQILDDEWIKADDVQETRLVPYHKLSPEGQSVAGRLLSSHYGPPPARPFPNKRKRPSTSAARDPPFSSLSASGLATASTHH